MSGPRKENSVRLIASFQLNMRASEFIIDNIWMFSRVGSKEVPTVQSDRVNMVEHCSMSIVKWVT